MNSKKLIKVGVSSSLIELKAELQRKQNELHATSNSSTRGVVKCLKVKNETKQAKLNSGKNSGIDGRIAKDKEERELEDKSYEKAKSVLEAKAKLYDEMQSSALNYDPQEHPVLINSLVDFQQKAIERIHEERAAVSLKSLDEPIDPNSEWTEFTDTLGRTRRCLKAELDEFIARDQDLAQHMKEKAEATEGSQDEFDTSIPPPPIIDPEEEIRLEKHKKWEEQASEVAGKSNVHYQDILYDEIRSHGVGYYEFDKDDEVRAKQLLDLKKISEHTEEERKKIEKAKRERKQEIKDRLRKIRQRKRAKLGLPMEDKPESSSSEEETEVPDPIPELKQPELNKKPMPKPPMRAWDYGKSHVYGPKPDNFDELDAKWLQNRRNDRVLDFAPPKKY